MQRMVSHELKTPLSSISGFGSMIETYELSRDEQVRVAGMIRREAERLADMVRTFLDLERLGAVNANNLSDDVDLRKLAVERCEVLRAAVVDSRKTLHVEGTEPCPVQGSVDLLVRVIDNLVGNAIKYCPAGSTIRVTTQCDGTTGSLEVADDGPGIDPEAVPHLFDRFYRVPGGHSSGSGLGLALVKEIAEHHGGSVHVSSEVGRGTIFTVELPTAPRGGEKP
jgi:signal transduction histidine kinase